MKKSCLNEKLSLDLIKQVFSPQALLEWIQKATDSLGGVQWLYVGSTESKPNPNNQGACDVSHDKRAAFTEIVFNMIDAVIDHKASKHGFTANSPKEAVEECHKRETTAGLVSLCLHDSGIKDRPTIDFRDLGIGQCPDNFHSTFVGINEKAKLNKPHLCGKFGMGMKSAFKFCNSENLVKPNCDPVFLNRMLIVSRLQKDHLGDNEDEIGMTIVRQNFLDGNKGPTYEYLCDSEGQIIRLSLSDFEPGTLIRAFAFDLGGHCGKINAQNNSLYQMMNSYIIDPPIQISVEDQREKKTQKMNFKGLMHSLKNPKTPNSHHDDFRVDLKEGMGFAHVEYFVFHPNESSHDKDGTKVKSEFAMTFSHNGQRHSAENRSSIKRMLNLLAVHNRMAISVDTSNLHPVASSNMYSSSRISTVADSQIYKEIIRAIQVQIASDVELHALDKETATRKGERNSAQTESLEREISSMAVGIMDSIRDQTGGGRGSKGVANGGGNRQARKKSDAGLPDFPTRIVIDNSPLVLPLGRFAHLTIDVDAKNDYITPGDGKLSFDFGSNSNIKVTAQGRLKGGKVRLSVSVPESTATSEGKFTVRIKDEANGVNLKATGKFKTVQPKVGKSGNGNKRTSGGTTPEPQVSVIWVYKDKVDDDTPCWSDMNNEAWTGQHPGECSVKSLEDGSSMIIFNLNADFDPIMDQRKRMAKHRNAFERILQSYARVLCSALLRQECKGSSPECSFASALVQSMFEGVKVNEEDFESEEEMHSIPAAMGPIKDSGHGKKDIRASNSFIAEAEASGVRI